jgi:hypothetical protein
MNGEEKEVPQVSSTPKLTNGRFVELTEPERMNLVLLASSPNYDTLKKLFEMEVIQARDEAMAVPPHEKEKRLALMDVAYAIAQFSTHVQQRIESAILEHKGAIAVAAAREATQDRNFIEKVILNQFS